MARAAALVGPSGLAVGVDLSAEMLAEAARRTALATNVRLVRSPLAPLDLAGGLADAVVSNCAINHAPDKEAVFREIHRVLRPGGRFVVSDVVADNLSAQRAAASQLRAGLAELEVLHRTEPYERGGVRVLSLTLRGRRPW